MNKLSDYQEKIVLQMLIQGHSSKEIAEWLNISPHHYKKIKSSLFKKYNIKRAIQLLPAIINAKIDENL